MAGIFYEPKAPPFTPLTNRTLVYGYSSAFGRTYSGRYAQQRPQLLSRQQVHRQRYRKASIRLRAVGSKEQTSVKLADLYSPHITVNGQPLEMKTSAGRLMARDLFG